MSEFYSSPNRLVSEFFCIARNAVQRSMHEENQNNIRREATVAVLMSSMAVETFVNIYFRCIVEEDKYLAHRAWLLSDIESKVSIDIKIKKWPKAVFGKSLDFSKGDAQRFLQLKKLRNSLTHFKSNHETIEPLQGIVIHGAVDTSEYDALSGQSAKDAFDAAVGIVADIFYIQGSDEEKVKNLLHAWCGLR